jgi:hypothetical protein
MGTVFARNEVSAVGDIVTVVTSFARWIRRHLRALGFNPLIRTTDRLEALVVFGVLVAASIAIPVAAQAGSQMYATGMRTATEQAHTRHSVDAVAIEGTTTLPADFNSTPTVRAQWRDGTNVRTEQVITPATVKTGEHVTIWLNDTGRVVAAPLTSGDAKLSALGAAGTVWVALVVGCALLAYLVKRGLDRVRDRAWEQELRLLAHNDDGWANRHT